MTSTQPLTSTPDDSAGSEVAEAPRRRLPPGLGVRIAVAVPGIAVAVGAVIVGGPLFALGAGVVAVLALYELYNLLAAYRPLRWAGYAGGVAIVAFAWAFDRNEHGLLVGLAVGLGLIAVAGFIVPRRTEVTVRMAMTLVGLTYVAVPFGALVLARELPHGGGVVACILVGTWVFDTAAYLGGRLWGYRPIAPRTSPNKTVEGTLAGAVGGTLAVWVAGLYMDWIAGWQSLVLGAAICAAAYMGDLFESMIKRDVGAKDSGRLLLAHGGVLDRFDALLFTSVTGYLVVVALVF